MISYFELKQMIKTKAVKSFDDWFLYLNQKQFMEDTGISVRRLKALRAVPGSMSLDELMRLTALLDINPAYLGKFIYNGGKVRMQ